MTPQLILLLGAISLPIIVALIAAVLIFSRPSPLYAAQTQSTSPLGAAIAVEGLLIQVGNGQSPETFSTVANISDVQLPYSAKTVDVSNVGNNWMAEIPTLLQYGKIQMTMFWVMEDITQRNSAANNVRGLRYLFLNKILANWQFIFPDGNSSTDAISAYVTSFAVSAKVAGVFEVKVELTGNDQTPSFV